jgi:hypothetical protein
MRFSIFLLVALALLLAGAEAKYSPGLEIASGAGITFSGTTPSSTTGVLYSDGDGLKFGDILIGAPSFDITCYHDGSYAYAVSMDGDKVSLITKSSDNSTAINAAIAEAHGRRNGGTVTLLNLFEDVDSTINMYGDVSLNGLSKRNTGISGSANPLINYPETMTEHKIRDIISVSNMKIEATGNNNGIKWWSSSIDGTWRNFYTSFKDLDLVSEGSGSIMTFYGIQNVAISGCTFRSGYGATGIRTDGNATAGVQGLMVSDCEFISLLYGIRIASTNNINTAGFFIDHCWFIDGSDSGYAIYAIGVNDINVLSSSIDIQKNSIYIDDCFVVRIKDNYLGDKSTTSGRSAITIKSTTGKPSQLMIDGNWLVGYNTEKVGINVKSTGNGMAERLYIRDNEFSYLTTAINYSCPARDTYSDIGIISGNAFPVCTTGVYGEGLANALITDNNFHGCTTPHNAVFETGIKIKDNINLADN